VLQLEGCRNPALAVLGGPQREGSGVVEQRVPPSGERKLAVGQLISRRDGSVFTYNTRLGHGRS
jgi:hypothetical protein